MTSVNLPMPAEVKLAIPFDGNRIAQVSRAPGAFRPTRRRPGWARRPRRCRLSQIVAASDHAELEAEVSGDRKVSG